MAQFGTTYSYCDCTPCCNVYSYLYKFQVPYNIAKEGVWHDEWQGIQDVRNQAVKQEFNVISATFNELFQQSVIGKLKEEGSGRSGIDNYLKIKPFKLEISRRV